MSQANDTFYASMRSGNQTRVISFQNVQSINNKVHLFEELLHNTKLDVLCLAVTEIKINVANITGLNYAAYFWSFVAKNFVGIWIKDYNIINYAEWRDIFDMYRIYFCILYNKIGALKFVDKMVVLERTWTGYFFNFVYRVLNQKNKNILRAGCIMTDNSFQLFQLNSTAYFWQTPLSKRRKFVKPLWTLLTWFLRISNGSKLLSLDGQVDTELLHWVIARRKQFTRAFSEKQIGILKRTV